MKPEIVLDAAVKCSLMACAVLPGAAAKAQRLSQPAAKPNIIFILTDDHRRDAAGYAGNSIISTPELDSLARRGTIFSNAFVTTPISAASRASILTGMYERSHGYTFRQGNLRPTYVEQSYPAVLRRNGYSTAFYGKLGVKIEGAAELFDACEFYDRGGNPDRRGYYYKTIDGDTVHLTRYTGHQAVEFIKNAAPDKPFCLSLSFSAPHAHDPAPEQYFWDSESDGLYEDVTIPDPMLAGDACFESLPQEVREGYNRLRWTWRFDTPEKYQHSVKGYYRMISDVDREIGKIRAALSETGLDENTIVIFMGDNGYFLGERQLAGKWLMYDNSLRVPLIIYDPSGRCGTIGETALNIDIASTILDAAGVDARAGYQGQSLLPYVRGGAPGETGQREFLCEHLWEIEQIPPSEGIRAGQWKYFRYRHIGDSEELYDLESDPLEEHNLAKDAHFAEKLAELRSRCDSLIGNYSALKRH